MPRPRSLLVVALVGGVGVAAAIAALRGEETPAPAPPRATATATTEAATPTVSDAPLAAPGREALPTPPAGVLSGRLLVTTGCRLMEIDLATLAQDERGVACWIVTSPGGRYLLNAVGPRQETGDFAAPELELRDRVTGDALRRPGACGALVLPAVDDAGTVYTCSARRQPVGIGLSGERRPIPSGVAVLPLERGALVISRGRLLALDGTDVLPAAPDAALFARARDGSIGLVEASIGGDARLRTYRDGAPAADVPVEVAGAGIPDGTTFTLASGDRAAWLPLLITRRGVVVQPGRAEEPVAEVLRDWPAAVAPDEAWVAVARDTDVVVASLDPALPRYGFRFPDPIGSVAWVPA